MSNWRTATVSTATSTSPTRRGRRRRSTATGSTTETAPAPTASLADAGYALIGQQRDDQPTEARDGLPSRWERRADGRGDPVVAGGVGRVRAAHR